MKKLLTLIPTLYVLFTATAFAATPGESPKAAFKFTSFEVKQNSWDYALLSYNVTDVNTGEPLSIPSFLINYEVKDRSGNVVSKGSGLYINVKDTKLGSLEDYTVEVSTMINGEKLSQSICRKASPKKLAMKLSTEGTDLNALASAGDLPSLTFSRPKFNRPEVDEKIQVTPSEMSFNVALNGNNYMIETGKGKPALTEQANYQAMIQELKKLNDEGQNPHMVVEPVAVFQGEVYTDNTNHHYELTAKGIVETTLEEEMASK